MVSYTPDSSFLYDFESHIFAWNRCIELSWFNNTAFLYRISENSNPEQIAPFFE